MTQSINTDAISGLLRKEMDAEVTDLMRSLRRKDLNFYEVAAMLSILRAAMDREYPSDGSTLAPVLELVRIPE